MRSLVLSKSGVNRIKNGHYDLKSLDLKSSLKPVLPGEWCIIESDNESWVGYVNPTVDEKYVCCYIVDRTDVGKPEFSVEEIIANKINQALRRRSYFKDYNSGYRLFYGESDGLAGLIIDKFENAVIIQINTAGIDKYREIIKNTVQEISGIKTYLLDNPRYRAKENLPTYDTHEMPDINICENGLKFKIRASVVQKVGFYFDHRENRLQLQSLLKRIDLRPEKGIDLFSYAGAWGASALLGGVGQVTFVDQGDFESEINQTLELNGLKERGRFCRQDVFKFLDESRKDGKTYDVIMCDPPAFAKSPLQKSQALEGYSKLHRSAFQCASDVSLCVFSSCTHYVSHEDFQKNIKDAAKKEGKRLQLLYSGTQGWDHPIASLSDKSSYIKSFFYIVEKT